MKPRSYRDEGIVLKGRNILEADKIITVFSKSQGKIALKAKGVRKITSRKRSALDVFNHVKFHSVLGKHIDIVTEVETLNSFPSLKTNLLSIGLAYHICELIDKFLADHQPHIEIYTLINLSLKRIDVGFTSRSQASKFIREFEINFLKHLGFGIPVEKTQLALVAHMEDVLESKLKSRKFLNRISHPE